MSRDDHDDETIGRIKQRLLHRSIWSRHRAAPYLSQLAPRFFSSLPQLQLRLRLTPQT